MIKNFKNISIIDRNSFHVDVTARELIEFDLAEDLLHIFTQHRPNEWLVLGGGNNTLFTRNVDKPTILVPTESKITIEREDDDGAVFVKVTAGVEWDDVVEWCVSRGLWGVENLSLIPGKAGAAPIQNIGAYGSELCDVLVSVDYFDTLTMEFTSINAEQCEFAYRESIFKGTGRLRGRAIVTAIHLQLSKIAKPQLHYADLISRVEERGEPTLRVIRDVICEVRREKLPDTYIFGNAGSFFKNPIVSKVVANRIKEKFEQMPQYPIEDDPEQVKLAAGWLIDRAQMKGYVSGRVGVHSKQALVLINLGGATGGEVLALAHEVQRAVWEQFSVQIEMEVNIF